MNIGGNFSYDQESRNTVKSIERQKSETKKGIRRNSNEQISKIKGEMQGKIEMFESRISMTQDQVSQYKEILGNPNISESEKNKYRKIIKSLQKEIAIMRSQLASLKYRMNHQIRTIRFQAMMREKMAVIRFSKQKSRALRDLAERALMMRQREQAMKNSNTSSGGGFTGMPGTGGGVGAAMKNAEAGTVG